MSATISRVDQRSLQIATNLFQAVGLGMTHDDDVTIRIEHLPDIGQRFAFGNPGDLPIGNRQDFAVEPQDRTLKGQPGPRARFEKRRDRDLSVKRFIHLDIPRFQQGGQLGNGHHGAAIELSRIQNRLARQRRQRFAVDPPVGQRKQLFRIELLTLGIAGRTVSNRLRFG